MNNYIICSEINKDYFVNFQFTVLGFNQLDEILKDSVVYMYDTEAEMPLAIVKELLLKNLNKLIYCGTKLGNMACRYMIRNDNYNIYEFNQRPTPEDLYNCYNTKQEKTKVEEIAYRALDVFNLETSVSTAKEMAESFLFNDLISFKEILTDKDKLENIVQLDNLTKDMIEENISLRSLSSKLKSDNETLKENIKHKESDLVTTKDNVRKVLRQIEDLKSENTKLKSKDAEKERSKSVLSQHNTELSKELENLKRKMSSLESLIATKENHIEKISREVEFLTDENQKLKKVFNQSQDRIDSIAIQMIETGNLKRLLYIKAVDMIPNVFTYFQDFAHYAKAKLKLKSISTLIIAQPETTIFEKYEPMCTIMKKKQESYPTETLYLMSGYDNSIQDYIRLTNDDCLIILDLSFINGYLLENNSIISRIYLIDDYKKIGKYKLDPQDCFCYNWTEDSHTLMLPLIEQKESGRAEMLRNLADTVYPHIIERWNGQFENTHAS